jgi:Transposase IS116/IS110/IS902 family
MSLCLLNRDGEILVHRQMPASPDPCLKTIAPSREDVVVWGECLCTWSWLADLWARDGMAFVLGHALYLQAIPGGQAQHDQIDAPQLAVWRRGGLLPHAYVYPAERRPTRALLRRRRARVGQRAALLPHVQQTTSPDHLPALSTHSAAQATREGGAERFPAPAGQKSLAGDLPRLAPAARRRRALDPTLVQTATPHAPQTLDRRPSGPGLGKMLRRVLVYARQTIDRFPRSHAFVAHCRLVKWAKDSAGTRDGPAGPKRGNASRKGAFAAAAGLLLRSPPKGQRSCARPEKNHGQGTALTVVAHQSARAVYDRRRRATVVAMRPFLHGSWSGVGEPVASLAHHGPRLHPGAVWLASVHAQAPIGAWAQSLGR